jgi:PAS domain S-box-containing protein
VYVVFDAEGRVVGSAGSAVTPYPDPRALEATSSYADTCRRLGGAAAVLADALTRVLSGASPREQLEQTALDGSALSLVLRALEPQGAMLSIEARAQSSAAGADSSAEPALKRLFVLLERLPMACLVLGSDLRVRYVNQAAEELFGYGRDEMVGREPFGLIVESAHVDFVREVFALLSSGQMTGPSFGENVTKSGRRFLSEWIDTRLVDEDGSYLGLLSCCTDVSERTRMEQALEHSEQRYRSLVECLPDAILVTVDSKINFVNPAALEMFQAENASDLVGKSLAELLHPDYHHVVTAGGDLVGANAFRRMQIKTLRNSSLPVELAAVPLADDPGAPGSLLVLRDVSAREALEGDLRQKQKLEIVGQLAGGVAHDFNNVLTVVLSACSLLSRGRLEPKAHDEVELIRGAAESAASLTRQLLTFARRQNVETRVFDLNELVTSAERLLHRVLGEDVELLVSASKPVWPVRADPRQIEQVILNLASNARAAMPEGGKLTLSTANVELGAGAARQELGEAPGRYVVLHASDTGAGMDRETLARVFEPFFTTKEAGAGLGLATCYGIVTQSGGWISAQSVPGSGSTFSVYLPAAQDGEPQPAISAKAAGPHTGSETVLLVDDNAALRSVTARILEGAGYRVLRAGSASEAMATSRNFEGKIELLLTDVVMPGMSGAELAPALLQQRDDLSIIYMSGYTNEQITRRGVSKPGVSFLQKPFTPLELLEHVRRVLDERTPLRRGS